MPRAHTRILAKDLALGMAMLDRAGLAAGLGAQALASFRAALAAGFRDQDDSSLLAMERSTSDSPPP